MFYIMLLPLIFMSLYHIVIVPRRFGDSLLFVWYSSKWGFKKFCAEDEVNMDGDVKEMEDHQVYKEQEYKNGDQIQGVIYNDVKHVWIAELLENGEKNKDSCDSSILKR